MLAGDIERLEEIFTNPHTEGIPVPRMVSEYYPDLWSRGYLRREILGSEPYGLYLTDKGLKAIGA